MPAILMLTLAVAARAHAPASDFPKRADPSEAAAFHSDRHQCLREARHKKPRSKLPDYSKLADHAVEVAICMRARGWRAGDWYGGPVRRRW